MKRIIYLLLISLIFASCTGIKKKGVNVVAFDSIVMQEKIKLLPNKPDSLPYATLDIKFIYPKTFNSKEQLQKLQSVFYENVLGEKCANASTPDSAVATYVKNYINLYRESTADYNEMLLESGEDNVPHYIYMHTRSVYNIIEYKNENLLNFSVISDEYLGGAHGYYSQHNVIVNLNTLEEIQEADIFVSDYKEPLAQVIKQKLLKSLRKENKGESDELLKQYFFDFDKISPNNNFLMDDKGLYYTYNFYEIAPYASGMFYAFVPYSEITHLLNLELFAEFFPDMDLKKDANEPITAEETQSTNYNEFPIAYVKNAELYFFNPENHTIMKFTQETDPVFNCVYSDQDDMFYYTVLQNENIVIKQVDLSVVPAQPKLLFNLNKPAKEFYSETYGEKALLRYIKGSLLLECDFVWDFYNFTKYYEYSIKDNTIATIDWDQFERKFGYHPYSSRETTNDYSSIYNKSKKLDLSKYMNEHNIDSEREYFFKGISADGSKIIFAIMLDMCDLAHGPYCVANIDGSNMQVLEDTDMGSAFKPLWSNNNVVYLCSYESETELNEWGGAKTIDELCYTQASDNSIKRIDQDIDYYAVRNIHPNK